MPLFRRLPVFIITLVLVVSPLISLAGPILRLSAPPLGERWYSVSMNDARVGFAHLKISETGSGYEIFSEGSVKMVVLGFSREAVTRETYLVDRDLSLRSFTVEQTIDGSPMILRGNVSGKGVKLVTESAGNRQEKTLKLKGKLLPPPALNLYPPMQGAAPGKQYRVQMLDVEAVKIKEVKIQVIGVETLDNVKESIHLRNDLYSFVDNDIWLDPAGNTIRESVRDGLIVTRLEDARSATRFIAEAALSKMDLILDFSLVKVDTPIENPAAMKKLVVALSGFPAAIPVLQGAAQKAERLADGSVRFTLESSPYTANAPAAAYDKTAYAPYLETSRRILADNPEIIATKAEVVAAETEPLKIVEKLTHWVATTVKGTVTDSQSPLETLESRSGNCQSHTRLYTSLARAAGIPTRFVSGLVYAPGQGFLYHSWAESFVGEWLAVDPTFGQVPVDASHIKLVEGDSPDDMSALAAVVGKLKAKVIEQKY
jgi:transglutaminase-like putative cysteine protease